jgi:transmembrane sensor
MAADKPNITNQPDPMEQSIDAMAAEWLAWRDTGLSARQAAEFARWRAMDPRHDRAIQRIEAAQTLLARLPEAPDAASMYAEIDTLCSAHRRRMGRKTWARTAVGLAAAAAVAFAVWLPSRANPEMVYATNSESRKTIDLPDGSTLALRENSEVRVDYRPHERRLDLESGEAYFSVAKDVTRPFVVSVGPVTVQAVGTAFTIRRHASDVDVIVTEGKVLVTRADPTGDITSATVSTHSLVAGERVRISMLPATGVGMGVDPSFADAENPTWEAPHIVFANTTFAHAVEQFNRHSRIQMEIGDPELGDKTLGGNFNANNADAFINLLSASGEVSVERISETRVVLHLVRGGEQ